MGGGGERRPLAPQSFPPHRVRTHPRVPKYEDNETNSSSQARSALCEEDGMGALTYSQTRYAGAAPPSDGREKSGKSGQ